MAVFQQKNSAGKRARAGRLRGFENLEARQMLRGSPSIGDFLARGGSAMPLSDAAATAVVKGSQAHAALSAARIDSAGSGLPMASSPRAARWDWLAGTKWYVPSANLLAYFTGASLRHPQATADQTIWNIKKCVDGRISGTAAAKFSFDSSSTIQLKFSGVLTKDGQIRIEFVGSQQPTTGIGQMRRLDGSWTMQMQMASGSSLIVTHWAYMTQLTHGATPPEPVDPGSGSHLSDRWKWLDGSRWVIAGSGLFGGSSSVGKFKITHFDGSYFWGSGKSESRFNVLGSVTPEGNLLLLVSHAGEQPAVRTGTLVKTSAHHGVMTLRTYEGEPAVDIAWTAGTEFPGGIVVPPPA